MFHVLAQIADIIETITSTVLILGILALPVNLAIEFFSLPLIRNDYDFSRLLEQSFNLIIGIEFTRMLYRRTPGTIIEVLLFATARQFIVEHDGDIIGLN